MGAVARMPQGPSTTLLKRAWIYYSAREGHYFTIMIFCMYGKLRFHWMVFGWSQEMANRRNCRLGYGKHGSVMKHVHLHSFWMTISSPESAPASAVSEEVQPSDEVNKSWRIHLRIAFDQVLRSDMNGFGFQLPALLCLWTLNFFSCQGKFSITKTPLIFLFSLFFCFPLLHFSHELQCLIKCEHSPLHCSYLCLAKEKMSLLLFPCMCLQTSH